MDFVLKRTIWQNRLLSKYFVNILLKQAIDKNARSTIAKQVKEKQYTMSKRKPHQGEK